MSGAPLYDHLKKISDSDPLRFDMPGHHGKPIPCFSGSDWTAMDCTEHQSTGDLFKGNDIIEEAEKYWAARWNSDGCLFLTGGSTEGVHIALHLCCQPGDSILVDRGSHRSLWNGLALLDVNPISVPRPWNREKEIADPLDPDTVDHIWSLHPEAKALFVTSPTYYGVDSDLAALAEISHRHHGRLIADCAHGAHYPWINKRTPCEQGADLTVISAHKELPVPGQSALLMYRGFSPDQVRYTGRIYGSSSPGYVMMTAMDQVRCWLDAEEAYSDLINDRIPYFWNRLEQETLFRKTPNDDPARLVISTGSAGYTGFEVQEQLEQRNILIEMADLSHLVLIASCLDTKKDFDRLLLALKQVHPDSARSLPDVPSPPDPPRRIISPRSAMFAPKQKIEQKDSINCISAEDITPYPPGIPIVAPGEVIEKKYLDYLHKIGYNEPVVIVI